MARNKAVPPTDYCIGMSGSNVLSKRCKSSAFAAFILVKG